jgi:hypothetical protein
MCFRHSFLPSAIFMTDVDQKSQENLQHMQIVGEMPLYSLERQADRVVLVVFMLTTEHSNASQLTQRALFNLSNAFSADTEHGGDFLDRVFPFACYDERAVASRTQAVLAVTTMLEVVAALGLATDSDALLV